MVSLTLLATACVAESTSWDSSASQACALGSDARGSSEGVTAGEGPCVGEETGEVAGEPRVGGGLAGGPMGCPTDGVGTGSDTGERLPGDVGDEGADLETGMTAARRTLAPLTARAEPLDAEVEVADTALLDADEAAALLRDACGDTVDSCSWISIMWSPKRMVRLSGALPDRKSFTCNTQ